MMQKNTLAYLLVMSFILVGCQTVPSPSAPTAPPIATPEVPKKSGVVITPYPDAEIKRESQPLPSASTPQPQRVIIPPTQSATPQNIRLKDGRGIAAYDKLMQDYLSALRKNNLPDAEKLLLQAQRIAPQSADVYRELARLANLRKQGSNAEAFARKGLTFAQNTVQKRQLWQQILQSAQLRQNNALIQLAQQNMQQLQ